MSTTNSCIKITCCDAFDATLGDFDGFSLVGGDYPGGFIYGNSESTFVVNCPPGIICAPGQYPVLVTLPENTVTYPYPPPPNGDPIILSIPCGRGRIVRTLPAGTSQAEIDLTIAAMIAECAQNTANVTGRVNTATIATLYANAEMTLDCNGLKFSASPGSGLLLTAEKYVTVPAGIMTSYESQEQANTLASTHAAGIIATAIANGTVQCGYWNTEQTVVCADLTEETVAAYTYFSAASQAAADQLAIDAAEAACPQGCTAAFDDLVWNRTQDTGPTPATVVANGPFVSISKTGNGVCDMTAIQTPITPSTPCSVRCYGNVGAGGTVAFIAGGTTWFSKSTAGAFDTTFGVTFAGSTATIVVRASTPLGFTNSINALIGPP